MAIIAGNFDLAEIIKVHKASDVGELNCSSSGLNLKMAVLVLCVFKGHTESDRQVGGTLIKAFKLKSGQIKKTCWE